MLSLQALLVSTGTVTLAEIGDKTQLLALLLAARYRKPWPIALGILAATLVNHAISAWLGAELTDWLSPEVLRWVVAASFLAVALWTLKPDTLDENEKLPAHGAFLATTVAFPGRDRRQDPGCDRAAGDPVRAAMAGDQQAPRSACCWPTCRWSGWATVSPTGCR